MAPSQAEPPYTVFIRLPFPRGNFVDPPPVNWDSSKDEDLWNIVSRVSKTEIDWNEIASEFEVTVEFLLQQVAWLTERHAAQLRAQMRKAAAAAKGSSTPSPLPGAESPLNLDIARATQQRAPSSLTVRRDSPLPPNNDGSLPGTPVRSSPRPQATRTSSSNTALFTTRNLGGSSRVGPRTSTDTQRRRLSSLPITTSVDDPPSQDPENDPPSPGPADDESTATSSSSSPAQSRIIRRPPRFKGADPSASFADADDADDDEDDEPAFLPYRSRDSAGPAGGQHDLSATLRGEQGGEEQRRPPRSSVTKQLISQSTTSDSSTSSAAPGPSRPIGSRTPSGPLSPRRTMELSGKSPGGSGKGKGYSRDSDGTPSMGSSFSDLDDASVTQSALEEALASKLGDGGTIGSLKGTISNAFRSRYMPK